MSHVDCEFRDQRIEIDGAEFSRCTFVNCTLVYSGGDLPKLQGCSLDSSTGFAFEGAAINTVMTMTFMYHGGFKEFIEALFDEVRNFKPPSGAKPSH